jgi:hypothetical protein
MTLDGKIFCCSGAATIRYLLEILEIYVTKTWDNVVCTMTGIFYCCSHFEVMGKEYEDNEGRR